MNMMPIKYCMVEWCSIQYMFLFTDDRSTSSLSTSVEGPNLTWLR